MVGHEPSNGNQMKANEKSNESLTGEKRNKKIGLRGLQSPMMLYNVNIEMRGMVTMDNQKLINKIDELLEVLRTEQQEAKGTGLALDWLKLTGELEEYKDELESLSYRREIIILCEYEFASNYKNSIVGFSDKDCQSIIEIIINYANSKKLDGIKLKNSAILAMFNFGLRLYLHGYTINDIDFLMGEMLEALLHVTL